MKKIITLLFALVAITILASSCSQQRRYVTDSLWYEAGDNRILYVSYWEGTETSYVVWATFEERGRVKRCMLQADNSLQCVDEAELEKVLAAED